MLFDHLMQDAGGCALHGARASRRRRRILRAAGFEELHFLRRYCAKLIYETQLYGGDVPWDALPDLYVETADAARRRSGTRAPTRSSTSIRGSTPRATCARGSSRR